MEQKSYAMQSKEIVNNFSNEIRHLLKKNLVKEYLFGSSIKVGQKDFSDIDILIIVKKYHPDLREKISDISSKYSLEKGVIFSPIIKQLEIWEKNKRYNTLFYNEIANFGIEL